MWPADDGATNADRRDVEREGRARAKDDGHPVRAEERHRRVGHRLLQRLGERAVLRRRADRRGHHPAWLIGPETEMGALAGSSGHGAACRGGEGLGLMDRAGSERRIARSGQQFHARSHARTALVRSSTLRPPRTSAHVRARDQRRHEAIPDAADRHQVLRARGLVLELLAELQEKKSLSIVRIVPWWFSPHTADWICSRESARPRASTRQKSTSNSVAVESARTRRCAAPRGSPR